MTDDSVVRDHGISIESDGLSLTVRCGGRERQFVLAWLLTRFMAKYHLISTGDLIGVDGHINSDNALFTALFDFMLDQMGMERVLEGDLIAVKEMSR